MNQYKNTVVAYSEVYATFLYNQSYLYCNYCLKQNEIKICACHCYAFCSKECREKYPHNCLFDTIKAAHDVPPELIASYIGFIFDQLAIDVIVKNYKKGKTMCQFCDWAHPNGTCDTCNSPFMIIENNQIKIVRCHISQSFYHN
jgi:hypothetical protein